MKTYQIHKRVQAARITAVGALYYKRKGDKHVPHVIEITLDDGLQFHEIGQRFEYAKEGDYFVLYEDGYKTVSPGAAFEADYAEVDDSRMPFGVAVQALRAGKAIAREGWNGKGLFVYLVPANSYPAATEVAKAYFGADGKVPYNAYMAIKNADGTVSTWAPSGSDALADDWKIVDVGALCQYATESAAKQSSISADENALRDAMVYGTGIVRTHVDGSQVHADSVMPSVTVNKSTAVGWSEVGTFSKTGPQVKAAEPAPRVTIEDIHAAIASEHYFTAQHGVVGAAVSVGKAAGDGTNNPLNLLTFCTLVLKNGYTVTGQSACVSAANFDADKGRQHAHEDAIEKCWPLLGFALAERLHAERNKPPAPGAAHPGYSAMQPHQQRVVDEKVDLLDKITRLQVFRNGPIFQNLYVNERVRLNRQVDAMIVYHRILEERIAAF